MTKYIPYNDGRIKREEPLSQHPSNSKLESVQDVKDVVKKAKSGLVPLSFIKDTIHCVQKVSIVTEETLKIVPSDLEERNYTIMLERSAWMLYDEGWL